jgi:hypothetical protein
MKRRVRQAKVVVASYKSPDERRFEGKAFRDINSRDAQRKPLV